MVLLQVWNGLKRQQWLNVRATLPLCLAVAAFAFDQVTLSGLAALWAAAEFTLGKRSSKTVGRGGLGSLASLLELYQRSDAASETLLEYKFFQLQAERELTEYERRWMDRLKDLVRLRALAYGKRALLGKPRLRQAFASAAPLASDSEPSKWSSEIVSQLAGPTVSIQDLIESAILVSDLYWKLFHTCNGEFPELTRVGQQLFLGLFGFEFELERATQAVATLTDRMQSEQGVVFAALSFLQNGELEEARALTQFLLSEQVEIDEDVRIVLYWMAELLWFTSEKKPQLGDHESTVRYLYHLCFSGPDRAGFLEVDSQFLGEFGTINELAREGFSFRETLFEKTLELWARYEGTSRFDQVFRSMLEILAGANSKLYDRRDAWQRFWNREKDAFSQEYLYVVEGNLSYAAGQFEDAAECYRRALELDANLRPALLNLVFAYAKSGQRSKHAHAADRVAADESLSPAGLYVAGNSYLLLEEETLAEKYFEQLRDIPGWEDKTDYYKSTFCFENGLVEQALRFAKAAHRANPGDTSVRYHLSLCHNALGQKDQALDMIRSIDHQPQWFDFYRFTLERDAGRHHEAAQTLLQIPSSYFQDEEELDAALAFAKERKDFVLMRHLRRSSDKSVRSA